MKTDNKTFSWRTTWSHEVGNGVTKIVKNKKGKGSYSRKNKKSDTHKHGDHSSALPYFLKEIHIFF